MMQQSKISSRLRAIVLILSLALCTPLMAMGGYAISQAGKGLIQKINYQQHTITVNGVTYAVSPTASIRGVHAFSSLTVGMPIQYMLGDEQAAQAPSMQPGDPNDQQNEQMPQMVVSITWLPGGIK